MRGFLVEYARKRLRNACATARVNRHLNLLRWRIAIVYTWGRPGAYSGAIRGESPVNVFASVSLLILLNSMETSLVWDAVKALLFLAALFHCGSPQRPYLNTVYIGSGASCHDHVCCNSTTTPCCSLDWVSRNCMANDTQIVFTMAGGATHHLNETVTFTAYDNIALVAEGAENNPATNDGTNARLVDKVTVLCKVGAGLSFVHCRDISLTHIDFLGCGSLQSSSSRANSSFVKLHIGINFRLCFNINLTSVNVTNSSGVGVTIVASGGTNFIQNCTFTLNNPNEKDGGYGGGGLQIEYPYCSPSDLTTCSPMQDTEYNSAASYYISNCGFKGNRAVAIHEPSYVRFLPPNTKNHSSIGYGGGLGIHLCKASNISFGVHNSAFVANSASYGGGVSCSFEEYSINNRVAIHGTEFTDNSGLAVYGGWIESKSNGTAGGLRVTFQFSYTSNNTGNTLSVTKSNFTGNKAYHGGGVLVKAAPETDKTNPTNFLIFTDCVWTENSGYLGGVAFITVYNETVMRGAVLKPTFEGCTFLNNHGNVVIYRLPIAFQRYVRFVNNNRNILLSSAILTVDDATVDFLDGCKSEFYNNTGHYGGAITLYGHSFLRVFPNTSFLFYFNYALRDGGAIYQSVSETQLLQNGPCFIQYNDRTVAPHDWKTKFVFDSNRENIRTSGPICNSILLGSVVPCIWEGYVYTGKQNKPAIESICLGWGNVLEFLSTNCTEVHFCQNNRSSCNCTQHIRTKPSQIKISKKLLRVTPGVPAQLGLEFVDDLQSNVSYEAVMNVWSSKKTMNLSSQTFYLTGDSLAMYGNPHTSTVLDIDTLPPRPIFNTINITFTHCPPGFVLQATSIEQGTPSCKCKSGFNGGVFCDGNGTALLRRGYWIGQVNGDDEHYVVGQTAYTHSASFSGTSLPKNDNSSILDDLVCGPMHRKGVLCGKCKDGFTPSLHGYTLNPCVQCDPHNSYGWMLVVVLELVPVTIFLVIVLIFNISVTSGPMNFFVFFAQVITSSFSATADGYIVEESMFFKMLSNIYNTLYSVWQLDINIPHEWCYTTPIPSPAVFLIVYARALYTFLFILIFLLFFQLHYYGVQPFYFCGNWLDEKTRRFRKSRPSGAVNNINNVHRSVIHALATFLVLSFSKIIQVSFILIGISPLVDHSGNIVKWVPLYYGDTSMAVYTALLFVALVFLTIFVFTPMLLLLVQPTKTPLVKRIFGRVLRLFCIHPGSTKLEEFLKVFQGCFKDGTGSKDEINCHKFAGFYLALRFIIFMLAALFPAAEFLLSQQIIIIVAVIIFAVYQPYREKLYNTVDIAGLAMLAVINSITIYHENLAVMGLRVSQLLLAIQYFLVFLPVLVLTVVLFWKMIKHFYGGKISWSIERRRVGTVTDGEFVAFIKATKDREIAR